MNKQGIDNWKLMEVIDDISIVNDDSFKYVNKLFDELDLPKNSFEGINRKETLIQWSKLPNHYTFHLDNYDEKFVEMSFGRSKLSEKEKMIITYDWGDPAIIIPTDIFIKDWEGFIASTVWETIMVSEDLELIMEVSRDYLLHSNFPIITN